MYDHDPAPPANPPLPDRPLDRLQVEEARHVLLHVAQQAQSLRTSLAAMYARNEQHQLVTAERVIRNAQLLADDLAVLVTRLGGPVKRDTPPAETHCVAGRGETQCGRVIRSPMRATGDPVQVTCRACATRLRAQAQ